MDLDGLSDEELWVAAQAVSRHRAKKVQAALGSDRLVVFAAQQNTDLTEGRGANKIIALFIDELAATTARDVLDGVQGTQNKAPVIEQVIFLSFEDWLATKPPNINKSRLNERGYAAP